MSEQQNRNHNCDLLAAYEMGLLADDERLGFEAHLTDCSDCLDELYAMAPHMNELAAHPGEFADAAAAGLQAGSMAGQSWLKRLRSWFLAGPEKALLPVVVVAAVTLFVFLPSADGPQFASLAVLEAPAYSPIQVRAGQQDLWLPLWESGMASYGQQDYSAAAEDLAQAISLLENQPDPQGERYLVLDNARLYCGVSQLLAGQAENSVAVLALASSSQLPPVSQKAQWSLAQAHLLNGSPDAALETLEKLRNSPVFGTRAAELILQIQALVSP